MIFLGLNPSSLLHSLNTISKCSKNPCRPSIAIYSKILDNSLLQLKTMNTCTPMNLDSNFRSFKVINPNARVLKMMICIVADICRKKSWNQERLPYCLCGGRDLNPELAIKALRELFGGLRRRVGKLYKF